MANYNSQFGDAIFADTVFGDIFNEQGIVKTWVEICPADSTWLSAMIDDGMWNSEEFAVSAWSSSVVPDSEFVNEQTKIDKWDVFSPSIFPLTKCNRS